MTTVTDAYGNTHYYMDSIEPINFFKPSYRKAKIWYRFGKKHNLDGPAVVQCDGTVEYWQYGKLHRENGPAVKFVKQTRYYKDRYYLCGVNYDYDTYLKILKLNKL